MRVCNIGVDIVEVERIRRVILVWGKRFLERIFSKEEIEYCESRPKKFQHYAGKFAAKEAVFKAINQEGLSLRDIEIVSDGDRPPKVLLSERAKSRIKEEDLLVSLSHTKDYAIAQAILRSPE